MKKYPKDQIKTGRNHRKQSFEIFYSSQEKKQRIQRKWNWVLDLYKDRLIQLSEVRNNFNKIEEKIFK